MSELRVRGTSYQFLPMTAADLPMVRRWLMAPHVVEWWGDAAEQFELVSGDLEHPGMEQLIIATDGRPFGYLQCYDLTAWPDEAFGAQPSGTHAIDQFIGEPDMIDRGHGSSFIRAFVDRLLAAGTPRVLTDPDVANARAIRAYAKAGFHGDRVVNTLEGPALLMVRDA
jgi:aminoglycoside 6'-N-acetyltransferase